MKKWLVLVCMFPVAAFGRQRIAGFCEQGGITLTVSGLGTISRKVQGSYPGCTVAVYTTGTLNLVSTYSDNTGTPKANPSASDSTTGYWFYYVDSGRYDIRFSGGGITAYTFSDVLAFDPNYPTTIGPQVNYVPAWGGATVPLQIDAACTGLGGNRGLTVIPPTIGAGNSAAGILDNCWVWDQRGLSGPNEYGDEGKGYLKDTIFRARWTTSPNSVQNYEVLHAHADPWSGGYNSTGGPKTNYSVYVATLAARTQGQHNGFQSLVGSFGEGDVVGSNFLTECYGGSNAGGDEGCEAGRLEADQGNATSTGTINIFTGTISSVTNNGSTTTLAYTGASNEDTRGELRWVIDTKGTKIYTTGTISGITGTPPTVTGSGTGWQAQFGSGAHTDLCFSLVNDDSSESGVKLVIPVRSITDDTHLVLGYSVQGADKSYNPINPTGNYRIYYCSQVTAGGLPVAGGSMTVTNGTTQWATSDTFEMPLGFDAMMFGMRVNIHPQLNMAVIPEGIDINNLAGAKTQTELWGINQHGYWTRGIVFNPTNTAEFGFDALGDVTHVVRATQPTVNSYVSWLNTVSGNYTRLNGDRLTGDLTASDSSLGNMLQVKHTATGQSGGFGTVVLNGAAHIELTSSNNDTAGQLTVPNGNIQASYSFVTHWNSQPVCVVTPVGNDPGGYWWLGVTTTTLTVKMSVAAGLTGQIFSYICMGNSN